MEEHVTVVTHSDFVPTRSSVAEGMCLYLKIETKLNHLKELTELLQSFLRPIVQYRNLWVGLHDCDIFRKYVEKMRHRSTYGRPIERLGSCLSATHQLLSQVLSSQKVTYDEITVGEQIQLEEVQGNLKVEFNKINNLINCGGSKNQSLDGITAMVTLFQAKRHIDGVITACKILSMNGCLRDSAFQYIEMINDRIATNDGKRSLTSEQAIEYMKKIRTNLQYDVMLEFFPLFQRVVNSGPFHDFVKEQFFCSNRCISEAVDSFHTWHQIISTQLQNEDFGEHVLRELSHAFACIVPFMDKEQTLPDLLTKVLVLNPSSNFLELQTVSANMHHIQRWSTQAEV